MNCCYHTTAFLVHIAVIGLLLTSASAQSNFADYFQNCHKNESDFDNCIKDALNDVRPFFAGGLPEYGIDSFDPFFIPEVAHKRRGLFLNYKLILKNVYESGWSISQVTRFRSDFNKNMIQYTQFFPDKRLQGEYEMTGGVMGNQINNKGSWNLTLYDYIQTTTVTRKPRAAEDGSMVYDTPLNVNIKVVSCKDMELHISRLFGGQRLVENVLDRVINTAWQPGFVVLTPIIDELVSTAFSEIFNKAFQKFPFDEMIH